ncbi:undecaprenyldiphospho-muramoylpentapeptide beta-N-acetylglucosaminyltransferase [Halalkalibacter akibai]|uniref:UDP-N-acetylglucosamine--N-acetylmuramyl-(pentapeptide) pyrophosphoryl-undecaprenol N-acetylglucosamine transferase n=1 Tax=Halalkalibacter akibai (strain ATCC 43226 / DSM 21942 / CIP 109018 / JCM 9157 / 1139) TaxID=1236973 RepID=W4QPL6_HALA3|nr:undecaprenyldiphospho-muramoylpentapeptide beta-N-acetylglucosaminyltransferase [Halalkalibacter akibai]GAE33857.1 UDP-N-acetylglucosamine-N-acetylmuramyl-(pentapeptide) pyrophosphoryl-undecaprenol N-acetylglucosamine transferase [Halalkalibacter akibai JCM 9157]
MRVIVSGGGTGGHIYPALSLINEIKRKHKNAEILYIGTEKGLEADIVPRAGIPFETIHISGFQRKLSVENVKTIARFITGTQKAKKIIKNFKPDVVIGTGGYVCGPVVYAASKLKIPTVIHEQNSVPGLTNKFLSKYVDKVAICFEEARSFFPNKKVVFTGNPRASDVMHVDPVAGRTSLGLDASKRTVLIVGGSRGARPINDAFTSVIDEWTHKNYQVVYVTGAVHYDTVMEKVKLAAQSKNVIIKPFIHNMPDVLGAVDLIVARAGATTLAEITALGLPSILIPSPYVTNNHQEKNALSLKNTGAAIVYNEKEMNGQLLLKDIDQIFNEQGKWDKMHTAAEKLGVPDAAENVYQLLVEVSTV